jgi:anti-anti-sigma factor
MTDGARARVTASADQPGLPVIAIAGEIDISNVEAVEAELLPLLPGPHDGAAFDLSELTFMDSSGIAMMLRAAERTNTIEIRNASPVVRRIIEATGLAEILRLTT